MKALRTLFFGLTLCAVMGLMGCQSTSSGGSSSGDEASTVNDNASSTNDNTSTGNDNASSTNDNAADPGDGDTGTNGTLTEEQEEAVNEGVETVSRTGAVFAALAAAGISSIVDGSFSTTQTCPTVTVNSNGTFIIDYGDGCSPVLYPDTTFSGYATGEVNLAERTITITFYDFMLYEDTLTNGTVEASVSTEGDTITFEAHVDLVYTGVDENGEPYSYHDVGEVTVEVDLSTGEIFIPYANLSTTDQTGEVYAVILEDVHIDWYEVLPDAGTCTLIFGDEGPDQVIMEIVFTEDTPTDGTVLVTVNGHGPYVMTLEDVETAVEETP